MVDNTPGRMIRDQAAWSFRHSPEALVALHWIKDNLREFEKLTEEFDVIVKNLNFVAKVPESIDESNFGAVARLKKRFKDDLPSLEDVALLVGKPKNKYVLDQVMETFTEIGKGLGDGGKWNWATKELPRVMASGLLVEGYAGMLSQGHGGEAVKRNIVLGIEEVGWVTARNSNIMADVKHWMQDPDEIGSFSPNIQKELRGTA